GQRNINSDFTPTMENRSNALSAEWKQNITSWLDLNAIGSYSDGHLLSQESYTNSPGAPFSQVALGTSKAVFNAVLANIGGLYGQPNYGNPVTGPYAFVLNPAVAGNPGSETLPTSNFTNNGIIGGSINRYTANPFAYDQSNGNTTQKSGELRLATHFDGPLNGIVGVYYLNTKSLGDYFVGSNTLDYGQTLFGGIGGASPLLGGLCISPTQANGCIYGSPFYDNQSARVSLESKSVYGEVYYDILPDLKLTGGLRYTEDLKESADRITIFDGPEPIGTTDTNAGLNQLAMLHLHDFDPTNGTPPFDTFENTKVKFSKLTGRAVLTWTPKVDWSDQTMFYASYSKGYKAGGSNPGVQGGNPAVPAFYQPEGIDAYEIGTKNTFMDGMFQANLSAWYYNYSGYQVSEVLSNTSVNSNTNAFLNGIEGEFVWLPQDNLQFSLNMDWMETKVGKGYEIDPRNPTGGLPNALLIKDGTLSGTNAQNCVLYYTGSNFATDFATLSAVSGGVFFAPPGGTGALAQYGVAHAAYGICDSAYLGTPTTPGLLTPALNLTHFAVQGAGPAQTTTGASVQLQGRELANSPPFSLNFGAQYTTDIGSGYNLVSRFDYYWQANMWGRIFNDTSDRLNSYGVGNLQFTLNAPDSQWYVQAFARNIFNSTNTTGEYLTSSSSGLWTGVFYGDPRIIGAAVGAHF
ncbi:MAG TPA: TonB-dependent receptor, partial [Rhizomicrobium sp.]